MSTKSICEERVYTAVFKEYSLSLFNYLYYKCGDESQAKDLMQDAFLKLWQNCKSVPFATARGFVFITANNALMNVFKHNKVKLKFNNTVDNTEVDNQSPAFLLEEQEFKTRLEDAISALPEKQRVVFLMSRIDKKTYKEIGELLSISAKAVEKRMYLALDTLRQVSKKIK